MNQEEKKKQLEMFGMALVDRAKQIIPKDMKVIIIPYYEEREIKGNEIHTDTSTSIHGYPMAQNFDSISDLLKEISEELKDQGKIEMIADVYELIKSRFKA